MLVMTSFWEVKVDDIDVSIFVVADNVVGGDRTIKQQHRAYWGEEGTHPLPEITYIKRIHEKAIVSDVVFQGPSD